MLARLRIKNIAIIEETEIPFGRGLNVLSGETGAGKSIVIEAISLLLGGRANADLVREGADEAVIEGLFEVSDIPWIGARLTRFGFEAESRELLIKRVVSRTGRHRIYVNGEMATLAILQELCDGLVDLCGQHEHQSLLKVQVQMDLLDRYGGLHEQSARLGNVLVGVRSLRAELKKLKETHAERAQRREFLRFQVNELKETNLSEGEDEKLAEEKKLLQTLEQRITLSQSTSEILDPSLAGEEEGVLDRVRTALSKARQLAQLDPQAVGIAQSLARSLAELEEALSQSLRYTETTHRDPERLEWIQERLAKLAEVKRKYGLSIAEAQSSLIRFSHELETLEGSDSRIPALEETLTSSEKDLRTAGQQLSMARKKAAKLLSDSVTAELRELKMDHAKFAVQLQTLEDLAEWSVQTGADTIGFYVQTNVGEPERLMGKIASGGELSRLMLAIRRVISDQGGIGVYLFDEVDAGIGGQTAIQVGKKLKSVASHNQVICITHLAQVASFADHHLSVRKAVKGKRTVTQVVELSSAERKKELTRMMGGPQLAKMLGEV